MKQQRKTIILRGLLTGVIVGLVVTLFDAAFMLMPHYVPPGYPLHLITFNALFWMAVFGVCSAAMTFFAGAGDGPPGQEAYCWTLFLLLPFAALYGILGRLYVPGIQGKLAAPRVFDSHLSFVWVFLFIFSLALYHRKAGRLQRGVFSVPFIPETVVIIVLFHFCSNPVMVLTAAEPAFPAFAMKLFHASRLTRVFVYAAGTALPLLCYVLCRRLMPKTVSAPGIRKLTLTAVLLMIVATGWTAAVYSINCARKAQSEAAFAAAPHNPTMSATIPSIILIVLDTVRADSLSVYGDTGASKNLEAFAQDSLVFDNCIASSSWTMPSHASLFTGLYPVEHGTHTVIDKKQSVLIRPLDEKFVTLAEVFRQQGYKTAGIAANLVVLEPSAQLGQGFQYCSHDASIGSIYLFSPFRPIIHLMSCLTHVHPKYATGYITADDIRTISSGLIARLLPSPFFLFVNFNDAHSPYNPPAPFNGMFLDQRFPRLYKLLQYAKYYLKSSPLQAQDAYLLSQYRGEVAFLDSELGKFFSYLKKSGIYDSALIVLTADHGELFGEHGLRWHRTPLYEGAVKVPLMIKFPHRSKTGRVNNLIAFNDIFPTILDICQLPVPDSISGRRYGDHKGPVVSELYNNTRGKHRALYDGRYKYLWSEHGAGPELYDLSTDPQEQVNIIEKLPAVAKRAGESLQTWQDRHPARHSDSSGPQATIDRKLRHKLEALGYVH